MSAQVTIFGADGYIGRHTAAKLEKEGHRVRRVGRSNWPAAGSQLGHVIFAVGMTAGFRDEPLKTVASQVLTPCRAVKAFSFDSFLYLSSTRVYQGAKSTDELATLAVRPAEPEYVYNTSKIAAESALLSLPDPAIRVARVSNVFGGERPSESFLQSILADAVASRTVEFRSAPDSTKDYLHVEDVCAFLVRIALQGRERVYNVASGRNTTHAEIACLLEAAGVQTRFAPDAPRQAFLRMNTARIDREFDLAKGSFPVRFAETVRTLLERDVEAPV